MVVCDETVILTHGPAGYLCCAACIIIWIIYGYLTRRLHQTYSAAAITLYQMSLAVMFTLPYALLHRPTALPLKDFVICIVIMGILSGGFGCLIEVKGLIDLRTKISGVYLNLLPVFTTITGMIFLHEALMFMQIVGCVIVVGCGIYINVLNEI